MDRLTPLARARLPPHITPSILVERGDRVSIQGDGHPTMASALAAFGAPPTYEMTWTMLNKVRRSAARAPRIAPSLCASASRAVRSPCVYTPYSHASGQTDSGCVNCSRHVIDSTIMSYATLWTMSVNDYFWASGNASAVRGFAEDTARSMLIS